MSDSGNAITNKVNEFIDNHEWDSIIWQLSAAKVEIDTLKSEISEFTWIEQEKDWLAWTILDRLWNGTDLRQYAEYELKDNLTWWEKTKKRLLELKLSITCTYFSDFKKFLKNLKEWSDVSRDIQTQTEVTPASTYRENTWDQSEQMQREENKWHPGRSIERSVIDKWREKWEQIPEEKVHEVWNYIVNWWTFYSPTRWTITWWKNKYKHVCSTWSYNVLWRLWFPKVSESLNVDLEWKILPRMWLNFIWTVDPDNPEKDWYKPQDWDTAVRPKFTRDSWHVTQHQATYINGSWVSDTIQNNMSCYWDRNEPRNVKIYRYTWEVSLA